MSNTIIYRKYTLFMGTMEKIGIPATPLPARYICVIHPNDMVKLKFLKANTRRQNTNWPSNKMSNMRPSSILPDPEQNTVFGWVWSAIGSLSDDCIRATFLCIGLTDDGPSAPPTPNPLNFSAQEIVGCCWWLEKG